MNDSIDPNGAVAKGLNVNSVYALARTELANDRTLLAYVRTAIALIASAIAMFKVVDVMWVEWISAALVAAGLYTLVLGTKKFSKAREIMEEYAEELIGVHPDIL